MSSNDLAIAVRGLGKSYRIGTAEEHSTLAEAMLHRARNPFRGAPRETFWALRDVNFDVREGDVVGIVGRNGAGKSTLLKILSRITEPTTGRIDVHGRIGSLLEVGTGFHQELTGRENIYLNGTILGMRQREIKREFDAIVAFSGVEKFLDTPVKRYSSGMYVRLAFAVAAHLQSEILIVDEVLAVGDAEFQRKCLGKMKDVAQSGRSVLFVSHHMQSVQVLCNRGMYLERGEVKHFGSVDEAFELYVGSFDKATGLASEPERRPGSGEFRFTQVEPAKETFTCGEEKIINFTIRRTRSFAGRVFLSAGVANEIGAEILHCDSRIIGVWFDAEEEWHGSFTIRTPWFKPGSYRVDLFICSAGVLDAYEQACQIEVIPLLPYSETGNDEATRGGVVFGDFTFERTEGS